MDSCLGSKCRSLCANLSEKCSLARAKSIHLSLTMRTLSPLTKEYCGVCFEIEQALVRYYVVARDCLAEVWVCSHERIIPLSALLSGGRGAAVVESSLF